VALFSRVGEELMPGFQALIPLMVRMPSGIASRDAPGSAL
jgi:hypothetical protein